MDRKLPLFIVTGASGVGKSTVATELRGMLPNFDVFETDFFPQSTNSLLDLHGKRAILLRFAYKVAQSGRGTIICGTMMPWDVEKCDDYNNFSEICYINLHCDDETRNERLRNRSDKATWTDEMLKAHENFAQWLLDNASTAYNPPMPTIDTSCIPPTEVAKQIKSYVEEKWDQQILLN